MNINDSYDNNDNYESTARSTAACRGFLELHYSDDHLATLIAACESGAFCYGSCCCFVGIVTSDHAVRSEEEFLGSGILGDRSVYNEGLRHLIAARNLPLAEEAEREVFELGRTIHGYGDSARRTALRALALAEQSRRRELRGEFQRFVNTLCPEANAL